MGRRGDLRRYDEGSDEFGGSGTSPRRRHWLALGLLLLGAAAWSVAPSLIGLDGPLALAVGAVSAVLVEAGGILRQRYVRRRNLRTILTGIHTDLKRADPVAEFGLRSSLVAEQSLRPHARKVKGPLPAYIPGEIDAVLDRSLLTGKFTLLTGNAFAGKSRAAFEALRRMEPSPVVLTPEGGDALRQLLELDPPLLDTWRPVVIWLGDLRRFIGGSPSDWEPAPDGATSPERLNALLRRHFESRRGRFLGRRVRISLLATLSTREYHLYTEGYEALSSAGAENPVTRLLRLADRVHLEDGEGAGWDLTAARQLYRSVDFSRGVGRAFAEADLLIGAYRHGLGEGAQAVVQAAVDWHRIGAGDIGTSDLRAYLRELPGLAPMDDAEISAGVRAASLQIGEGERLLSVVEDEGKRRLRPHPYLIDADEGYGPHGEVRGIPAESWLVASQRLGPPELFDVAEAARAREAEDMAERIWAEIIDGAGVDAAFRGRAYIARGDAYLSRDPGRAEAEYTRALSVDNLPPETRASAYLSRGIARSEVEGQEQDAERDLTTALEMVGPEDDTGISAQGTRGGVRLELRRFAEAKADLLAVTENPQAGAQQQCYAYAQLGSLHMGQERLEEAAADFTRAIAIIDGSPETRASALGNRAIMRWQLGDPQAAEEDLTRAIELRGAHPSTVAATQLKRGVGRKDDGRLDEADADFSAVIANPAASPYERGVAYVLRGFLRQKTRPAIAEEDFTTAIESAGLDDSGNADAYHGRGEIRGLMERWREADEDLTTALGFAAMDGSHIARILLTRAVNRYRRGDLDAAEADLTATIETQGAEEGTRGRALVNRGFIRIELERYRAAERDLRAALDISGEAAPDALNVLGDLLRGLGRQEDELALYRAIAASGRSEVAPIAAAHLQAYARRNGTSWWGRFLLRRRGSTSP